MAKHQSIVTSYAIEGHGQFPIDMLRYDGVHPATESDSGQIESTFRPGAYARKTTVGVAGIRCTPGRWISFGWTVIE